MESLAPEARNDRGNAILDLREGIFNDVAMPSGLFQARVAEPKLNPLFVVVRDARAHAPTRGMLEEAFSTYGDIDGNFIREFQTSGFSQRVWELYLHAYLSSSGFVRDVRMAYPDFVVSKGALEIAIEAVTTNPTEGGGVFDPRDVNAGGEERDLVFEQDHLLPIKIEKALTAKVNKGYAKHPHVAGKPLVLALELFHEPNAFTMSGAALSQLLYGLKSRPKFNDTGSLEVVNERVPEHSDGARTIPSGFFSWETTRDISAVLFSNAGTIAKFQRMGQQGSHADNGLLVIRKGTVHDPDPNADLPRVFAHVVGDPGFPERWGDSLLLIHNPNAKVRLPQRVFPDAAEYWLEDDRIEQLVPTPHILGSITLGFDLSNLPSADQNAAMQQAKANSYVAKLPKEIAEKIREQAWGADKKGGAPGSDPGE